MGVISGDNHKSRANHMPPMIFEETEEKKKKKEEEEEEEEEKKEKKTEKKEEKEKKKEQASMKQKEPEYPILSDPVIVKWPFTELGGIDASLTETDQAIATQEPPQAVNTSYFSELTRLQEYQLQLMMLEQQNKRRLQLQPLAAYRNANSNAAKESESPQEMSATTKTQDQTVLPQKDPQDSSDDYMCGTCELLSQWEKDPLEDDQLQLMRLEQQQLKQQYKSRL